MYYVDRVELKNRPDKNRSQMPEKNETGESVTQELHLELQHHRSLLLLFSCWGWLAARLPKRRAIRSSRQVSNRIVHHFGMGNTENTIRYTE